MRAVLTSYEVIDFQQQFEALGEVHSLKEKVSEAQCHGPGDAAPANEKLIQNSILERK